MNPAVVPESDIALENGAPEPTLASPALNSGPGPGANVQWLVLSAAGALYFGLCFYLLRAQMLLTGALTYPLDDPYIGMKMAKNFALHGVWGITQNHFASAASSPGFVLLLAAVYRLGGTADWWPLVLSLGFGMLALVMAQRLLRVVGITTQLVALCAIVIFTPLYALGLLGMEHALHLALTLAFLDLVGWTLARERSPSGGLLLLTGAMAAVRYESVFMIIAACLLFFSQRQIRAAVSLAFSGAIPLAVYGAFSVLHGAYWLPNSVSLKGISGSWAIHNPMAVVIQFDNNLGQAPHMAPLIAAMFILLLVRVVRADRRAGSMLAIVLAATLLHLSFAQVGSAYRYEAYLVAGAIAAIAYAVPHVKVARNEWASTALLILIAATLAQLLFADVGSIYPSEVYVLAIAVAAIAWAASHVKLSRQRWATAALLVIGVIGTWMLFQRALLAVLSLPYRSMGVYCQQIQMARFLNRFEQGVGVAANDVGAINYYADINCLDLAGLADQDVYWLKKKGGFSTVAIARLAEKNQVKIALVYDSWFSPMPGPSLPSSWVRVERWHTPYATSLGGNTVSFYVTDPAEAVQLRHSLDLFAPSLPAGVQVFDR
jgi:hypothetical protein